MLHYDCTDFIGNKIEPFILCVVLSLFTFSVPAVEVIINAETMDQITDQNELRSIFSLRKRTWSNGKKIRVFVLPDNNVIHKAFVKEKLHMFPHQLRRTWNRMTYTGTGQPPIIVYSVPEMLEKIKTTPYAIGYLNRRIEDENIRFFDAQ